MYVIEKGFMGDLRNNKIKFIRNEVSGWVESGEKYDDNIC